MLPALNPGNRGLTETDALCQVCGCQTRATAHDSHGASQQRKIKPRMVGYVAHEDSLAYLDHSVKDESKKAPSPVRFLMQTFEKRRSADPGWGGTGEGAFVRPRYRHLRLRRQPHRPAWSVSRHSGSFRRLRG